MPTEDPVILRRRKAYTLAKQLKLDRDARIALARILLWRDVESWKELDDSQIQRLLDAMEGFALISYILTGATPPLPQPATV